MRLSGATGDQRILKYTAGRPTTMRAILGRGPQGLPGPGAAAWAPSEVVSTGSVRQAPDGSYIKSVGDRTTRATFDATEQTFWTAVLATAGTIDTDAIAESTVATYEPTGFNVGIRSDAFMLRSSDDGDQSAQLSAFLADTNLAGKRRILGHAELADTVTLPAGSWVDASLATFEQTAAAKTAFNVTGDNVRLVGAELIGVNASLDYVLSEFGIVAVGASAASPIRGLLVEDCTFDKLGFDSVYMQYVEDFTIEGNRFTDQGYSGVVMLSCHGGLVSGNIIDGGEGEPLAGNAYGIITSRSPVVSLTTNPRTSDIKIIGNTVRNFPTWTGIDTHAGSDISILGNTVYGTLYGLTIGSCPDGAGGGYAPLRVSVVGNTVDSGLDNGTSNTGITFTGMSGALSTDPAIEYGTGTIVGNNFYRCGSEVTNNLGAISARNTSGLIISGNDIDRPSPHGIAMYYDNRLFVITGNTVSDAWSNDVTVAQASAVAIRSANNTGIITGNTLRTTGNKSATYLNTTGIAIASGPPAGTSINAGPNDFTVATNPITGSGAAFKVHSTIHSETSFTAPDGTPSAPSYSYTSDADTGLYWMASGTMAFVANTNRTFRMTPVAIQMEEGKHLQFGTTTGTQIGSGATQKLGFWGVTPIVRPSAWTQTYSTASKTVANPTATTPAQTSAAVVTTAATQTTPWGFASQAQADAHATTLNQLVVDVAALRTFAAASIVDVAGVKQNLNSSIDEDQAVGLKQ